MTGADTGRVVGQRYRIEREIASGGMGTVFEAKHTLSQKTVALKVLHPEVAQDEQARQRFLREVAAPARIGHDGICEVYDAGIDEDGAPFVAMELLQGETLRERLERPGLSADDKLGYFHELLEALAAAHAKGLVHRDLKPENVFLSRRRDGSEVLKLLDFGIVRELSDSNVTQAGVGMGTPDYMSPEQATNAKDVTARTDVWSIGVMLYEALAGEPPFRGNTPSAIVVDVITRPHTPLRSVASTVSPGLSDLIDRCLSKDPKARPENAGALLQELKRVHIVTATLPRTVATPSVANAPAVGGVAGPFSPPSASNPYGQQPASPAGQQPAAAGGFGSPPSSPGSPAPGQFGAPQGGGPVAGAAASGYGGAHGLNYGSPPGQSFGSAPGKSFGSPPGHYGPGHATPGAGTALPPSAYGLEPKKRGCGTVLVVLGVLILGSGLIVAAAVGLAFATGAFGSPTARLRVNTNVEGGELVIDGQPWGPVENHQILEIEPGTHQVELRHGGTPVASQTIQVTEDGFADALLHRVAAQDQAQVLQGELGPGDGTLTSGEYRDVFQFQWSTGAPIEVTAESSAFDAYLIHRAPSGAQHDDDDGGGGTNARIQLTAQETGTHTIMVTSFRSGEVGPYTLRVGGSGP